jgi:hypothetical protein
MAHQGAPGSGLCQAARQLAQTATRSGAEAPFLYAEKDPVKFERAALRWLARYVTEGKAVSLLKAQLALSASQSFGLASVTKPGSCSLNWLGGRLLWTQFRVVRFLDSGDLRR